MIVCIDASNIRVGGGVTHLVEMLRAADPIRYGFSKVIVWGPKKTLDKLDGLPNWLVRQYLPQLDQGLLTRAGWQRRDLSDLARSNSCDLLFVPGGTYVGNFKPVVSMSQNLLPFEFKELLRYGLSKMLVKMLLLRRIQSQTFTNSDGVIFLTKYAHNSVRAVARKLPDASVVIPLGINLSFRSELDVSAISRDFSSSSPCRITYVSVVDVYKHQCNVALAVKRLSELGMPVSLDLVGPGEGKPVAELIELLKKIDPESRYIRYLGPLPHTELSNIYKSSDINVFASSCENMPNILIEAMSSGVPVASSNYGPMPEVLKDGGVYFDPLSPVSIANTIANLFMDKTLRLACAKRALELAGSYSWQRCADETFAFFLDVLKNRQNHNSDRL